MSLSVTKAATNSNLKYDVDLLVAFYDQSIFKLIAPPSTGLGVICSTADQYLNVIVTSQVLSVFNFTCSKRKHQA